MHDIPTCIFKSLDKNSVKLVVNLLNKTINLKIAQKGPRYQMTTSGLQDIIIV